MTLMDDDETAARQELQPEATALAQRYQRSATWVGGGLVERLQAVWHIIAVTEEDTQELYFIQAGEDGPIKIGISQDAKRRLSGLQTAHHEELRLLGSIPGGRRAEEFMHQLFVAQKLRGEWFKSDPVLLSFIEDFVAARLATKAIS